MTKVKGKIFTAAAQGVVASKVVGAARKEKNFQAKLDAMQLAVAKGEVILSAEGQKAKKELERIKNVEKELTDRKLAPISNYAALQALYNNGLTNLSLKDLQNEYANKAAEFISRALVKENVTDAQRTIVMRYYSIQAEKEWAIVDRVKNILAWRYAQERKLSESMAAQENAALANEPVVTVAE